MKRIVWIVKQSNNYSQLTSKKTYPNRFRLVWSDDRLFHRNWPKCSNVQRWIPISLFSVSYFHRVVLSAFDRALCRAYIGSRSSCVATENKNHWTNGNQKLSRRNSIRENSIRRHRTFEVSQIGMGNGILYFNRIYCSIFQANEIAGATFEWKSTNSKTEISIRHWRIRCDTKAREINTKTVSEANMWERCHSNARSFRILFCLCLFYQ